MEKRGDFVMSYIFASKKLRVLASSLFLLGVNSTLAFSQQAQGTGSSPVLSTNATAPGREFQLRQPSLGTGAQRLMQRTQYSVGGGATEQGAAFALQHSRDHRYAAFRLEIQAGAPVLRIQGQAQVLPVNLVFNSLGRSSTGVTFFNLQIVPTVRGRYTLEDLNGALRSGQSNISVSADFVAHFLRLTRFSMDPASARQSALRLASLRLIAGIGGGLVNNASGLQPEVGPSFRIEGQVMIGLTRLVGLDLGANGFAQLYNFVAPAGSEAIVPRVGFGGHAGVLVGAPTSPNAYARIEGNAELDRTSGEHIRYVGGAVGVRF
jgi:hypothetical protein